MAMSSRPLITNKKAALIRKKLYRYSLTDAQGNQVSGYIKSDSKQKARFILYSKNPGCDNVEILEFKQKK